MTSDLRARVAARLGELLARLGELVDADPARELAPVPGDLHGPPDWPITAAPKAWPEGLPWPLSALQAFEHLQAAQLDAVAWVESDIRAAVAWLVAPELVAMALTRPDLVDKWRWPWLTAEFGNGAEWCGPSYAWRLALGRLLLSWGADLPPADAGGWPDPGLTHREVAAWARPVLNLRRPAVPYDPQSIPGTGGLAQRQGLWDGTGELSAEVAAAAWGMTLEGWRKEHPGKPALGDALVAEVESWGEIRPETAARRGQTLVARRADGLPAEVERTTLALLYLVEWQARESLPGELLAVALAAVRAWESPAPSDVHDTAARKALETEKGPAEARERLAGELRGECATLVARLTQSAEPGELRTVPERGGLMALDAELVAWLAERDQGEADALRKAAGERLGKWRAGELGALELFARWLDGRALLPVAGVLWRARVADLWKIGQKVAAYPRQFVENMATTIAPRPRQARLDFDGENASVRLRVGGHTIAEREATSELAETLRQVVVKGGKGLTSLGEPDGLQLLVYLQTMAHAQRAAGFTDYRTIKIPGKGGKEKLSRMAKLSQDGRKRIEVYLEDLRLWRWPLPGYRTVGGLATWRDTIGGGLVIELSRLAAGEWVEELREMGERVPPSLLSSVPIPYPLWDLKVVGPRLRRRAVSFFLHVMVELQERRSDLVAGGVPLDARAVSLAEDCGLKGSDGLRLLGHWRELGHLKRNENADKWELGDKHSSEYAYLEYGAKRTAEGKAWQKRSKAEGGDTWRTGKKRRKKKGA